MDLKSHASTAYMALHAVYIERMTELVDSLITVGHL